ncbi:DUF305 domain-containing protein [Jidongwangia harbinensis]|uniref:DUF305 domain-containing protein n=1 Tax=Jidongwangia harbinensis TaxID=2878561 RepID=UPI003555D9C3|nr:DUF305 domain-containing protein [Jidongwangia harbinensis]
MRRRYAAVLIAAALFTGACGTEPEPPTEKVAVQAVVQAEGEHNDTDVMYLQMMIAHHEQGLQMVRLAAKRAQRSDVRTMAAAVDAVQSDEVTMMKAWLTKWSAPTTVDHAPDAHADHGGLPATGPNEIAALRKAKGPAVDTTFLNLFLAHQHSAVEMAGTETTGGKNAEVKALAQRIRDSRTDQIKQMLNLLNG